MKYIREAQNNIFKAWGSGKPAPGVWRLMTCVLPAECPDGTLLYHTVTGELLLLSGREAEDLAALPCGYAPWMDSLIEKRFLVPEASDDTETVNKLRTILRMISRSTALTAYTILPTMACNARCFYCYEGGMPHRTMSEETVRDTVEFIAARHGDRPVLISWFGGEPTLGSKQIDQICAGLKEKGIEYTSSMISNGYLLTEDAVKHAKEDWKLTSIQITLDGTEEVYNRTKAYVGVTGSPYQQVLENIGHLLAAEIRVSIRLNLGMHNAEDLETLVRELAARYENRKYLGVYSHLLFEDCGYNPFRFANEEKTQLQEKEKHLADVIAELGLGAAQHSLPVLKLYECMSDNDCSVIINPDGILCKCEHHLNDLFAGTLKDGLTGKEQLKESRRQITFPQCSGCFYYPACIKLSVCVNKDPCSAEIVREKQDSVRSVMKQCYEEFLKNPEKAGHGELPSAVSAGPEEQNAEQQ